MGYRWRQPLASSWEASCSIEAIGNHHNIGNHFILLLKVTPIKIPPAPNPNFSEYSVKRSQYIS